MANSGGGVIVYGVRESQKAATGRVDIGGFDETHERALISAAITAISPPVFGVKAHRLGSDHMRAVIVEVPASVDGPHLIYRGEYFGAPIRNDSDTVWMKERQIEAMYGARFDERRHATEVLDNLYKEASAGRDIDKRAWLIAVAHPRVPGLRERLTREQTEGIFSKAKRLVPMYADSAGAHPLNRVEHFSLRPGLRRWVAPAKSQAETPQGETWISSHFDGSVSLAMAVGGDRSISGRHFEGREILSSTIECAVADFMAITRATADVTSNDEYEVRVGVEWSGQQALTFLTRNHSGDLSDWGTTPLREFSPVEVTVNAAESDLDFHSDVQALAQDCINQGGISNMCMIRPPKREDLVG